MAMVLAALLMSGIVCTSSQYIYSKDRCASNGETMMKIRELVIQQGRIQKMVDSLRRMVKKLEEDVTKTHENARIVRKELNKYKDCKNLYINDNTESGVYEIHPFGNNSKVSVFCDMMTEGGGWTAIQRRVSGSVSFDRTWTDYKTGFGNPNGSYWIGNDVIHQLTKRRNSSLYVSITLTNGKKLYELYNKFSVADETNSYQLFLGGPATGTLGDSMLHTGYPYKYDLSGMYFSTPDRDNDRWSDNCAALSNRRGGWWFNWCHQAFLNGFWSPESWYRPWFPTVTDNKQIKETLMMIKYN
ncbi:microfibril-associated glycoprotein 4-like isoform X2 [Saccostrea cucullata]|uniref:microfibril-associated glycoprotein 4-like isoform X2 n=1 Tax=Saccostrea cuccullata TaxID=36930 RepID=UPI002ED164DA